MAEELKYEEVRDLYLECLKREGYLPKLDEDGDIDFKKEGRRFNVSMVEKDLQFFSLSAYGSYNDILRDRCHALEVINDVQFFYKAIKMMLYDGDEIHVVFKIENFLDSPVAFENVLLRSVDLVCFVMNNFEKSIAKFDAAQVSST